MKEGKLIYTIGHSNLELETFLRLLKLYKIGVLVDVRSVPYSRYASQFNKSNIQKVLPANGIKYLFLGKELGGRPQDPRFYDSEGNVLYSKIAESPCFTEGIERLTRGIRKYQVAIMCSEENPDHCHRRLLIGEILTGKAIQVLHIRKNGTIQSGDDIIRENKKC